MPPANVADPPARVGGRQPRVVAFQPVVDVEEIDLLGPEHAGEGLALDQLLVRRGRRRLNGGIELI